MMRSSYQINNFGTVFYYHVIAHKPSLCVELGVLDGYSTVQVAKGLRQNQKDGKCSGHLIAYDLWDEHEYNHGNRQEVLQRLEYEQVTNYVELRQGDAFEAHSDFKNESIDFLHIDISNTGKIFNQIFKIWDPKIKCRGLLLFEGGSLERDRVEWMIKYNKDPIKPAILNHTEFNRRYHYGIFEKFPSLTIGIKKLETYA